MSSLNRILVIGECIEAPDAKVTNSGEPFTKLKLSVERPDRGDGMPSQKDIIPVIAWRNAAEKASHIVVGSVVLADGKIITRTYDDAEGVRRWETEVEAREVKVIGTGQHSAEGGNFGDLPVSLEESPLETGEKEFSFDAVGATSEPEGANAGLDDQLKEDIPF
jgi:single-strand DNA-binding protein